MGLPLCETGGKHPAYPKEYLEGTMNLIRLVFIQMNEINDLDIYQQIDAFLRFSDIRQKMDEGNWSALMKGWKQVYHSVPLDACDPGEKADGVLLHWMADIYTYWQWKYNRSSRIMSYRCPAKELAKLFYPLHEASIPNAAGKLDQRFF